MSNFVPERCAGMVLVYRFALIEIKKILISLAKCFVCFVVRFITACVRRGGEGGCGGGTEARHKSGLIVTFWFYFSFFGEA